MEALLLLIADAVLICVFIWVVRWYKMARERFNEETSFNIPRGEPLPVEPSGMPGSVEDVTAAVMRQMGLQPHVAVEKEEEQEAKLSRSDYEKILEMVANKG